jgi:MarR family transcriptional regulator for hemolysin
VELTTAGDQLFLRLREAAVSFDRRLRAGLSDDDTTQLEHLLDRLRANVTRPTT